MSKKHAPIRRPNGLVMMEVLYPESQVDRIVSAVTARIQATDRASGELTEIASRLDELAQVARFIPQNILLPRIKALKSNLATTASNLISESLECVRAGLLNPVYVEQVKTIVSDIQDAIDKAIVERDRCQALAALFAERPINQLHNLAVQSKEIGRKSGATHWRRDLAARWLEMEEKHPDAIAQFILYKLKEYYQRDQTASGKAAFDSLNRAKNASDYRYRLLKAVDEYST